ncbi:MAG: AAA family ATPase [bacterium]|nr:AAA family ATPase [bacterium]
MRTIAFFNNKGRAGKTMLVYHLANMFSRLEYTTLAVDLDPQANLTAAFFEESRLEELWEDNSQETILACVQPILDGAGDIQPPHLHPMADYLWLMAGDLGLSRFEDKLSESWPRGYNDDAAALRATTAFHRLIVNGAAEVKASVILVDAGSNLGAINRSALLAADYLVIPLAADLFPLQGLRNLGPTIRSWRNQWHRMRQVTSPKDFSMPEGNMSSVGYVILQHAVRLDRPVHAVDRWLEQIPAVYRQAVRGEDSEESPAENDPHCLSSLRNFRSLMPMAQDARKPMFDLKPADGAIGSHLSLVRTCYQDFESLALKIAEKCQLGRG